MRKYSAALMQLQPEVLDSTPRCFTARAGEDDKAAATSSHLSLKLCSATSGNDPNEKFNLLSYSLSLSVNSAPNDKSSFTYKQSSVMSGERRPLPSPARCWLHPQAKDLQAIECESLRLSQRCDGHGA